MHLTGKVWLQLVIIVNVVVAMDAAKILFLSCTPARSHQKPFQVVWRALSQRGHDVHVLTPNPLNDPTLNNLTEYDLSDFYEDLKAMKNDDIQYFLHRPTFFSSFVKDVVATKMFSRLYNKTINHQETRRLLRENDRFDAVIVEWIFPTLASIGAYYKAPIIGITSLGAPLVALDSLGNPSHPLVAPEMNLPLKRDLSIKERLLSVLYAFYVRLYYWVVVLPREDENVKKHLSSELPYIGDIAKSLSLLLMNRNPVFHRVVPLNPNTIDLGGISVLSPATSLDSELKVFIEKSSKGVIYFSLGSLVQSVFLPPKTIETIQNVFKSLPYSFVWKWENSSMINQPTNVYISNWIPQTALLEHPNVKLFITQGGLQSTEEAIAAHKPIIGIPFHSDQTTNVDTCAMYGMGKLLDMEDITIETLRSYILEIVNNPRYAENAKKLDELMKDQPQDGLDKAIWWIEYVIRHKGAKHLRSIAVDLPWWQYFLLDVFGFIFTVLLIFLLSVRFTLKLVFRLISYIRKPKEKSMKKKKQ
ncbi:UDP-glycosyltransferase UGT5 isoform X2 [Dendroctonus ponderosae]|uniref:UDP-glucuronosyltransferase n=1 Tax=Dendroctonus ponderosae TaxID=77166 RepID=A0AAR5P461_DENPD|nr:UDP-glycosyltransferase UGT5 isoform X2 [Dendroctonus ponderosae]KAH1022193.1 hypothetical protein HUJ04_011625 [Dendroctonus ponderosae]KAH1028764.1 hypothetical protein HUJ05_002094 [Dendroctonus ponderosae]